MSNSNRFSAPQVPPPPPSPLWLNTPWATASPAAGDAEFRAQQAGGCYYGWPFKHNDCNSCQWCPRGPMPAGYPFGPVDPARNWAAAHPPAVPASGSFQYGTKGDCKPYGRSCTIGPGDFLAPTGGRSVKIAEPNVWTMLPNQVPPSVAVNWYNMGNYINDIYANRRGKPFRGCQPGAVGQCACRREDTTRPTVLYEPRMVDVPVSFEIDPATSN